MVAFIHDEWNRQWYVYVPGVVRVTLNVWPWLMIWGEFAGVVPGAESQTTS